MTDEEGIAMYEFLPSVREGIRPDATFSDDPTVEDPGRVTVEFDVQARENDGVDWSEGETESREVTLQVYGPGDVIGIDRRQVVRTEPTPGTGDFPPNYFPTIEFDRPDLPWMFSPEQRGKDGPANARARPWCCLVIAERREGVTLDAGGPGPLPVLEISTPADPGVELPDLEEVWAWAHAQVVDEESAFEGGTDYLDDVLTGNAENTVSRLVSPRNLLENRSYYACMVPVFEPGRRVGLGENPYPEEEDEAEEDAGEEDGEDGEDTAPARAPRTIELAWDEDDDAVRLPVYYYWEFSTGPRGDFEVLAKRLEPRTLGPNIGYRDVDVEDPGPNDLVKGGAKVTISGALRSASPPEDLFLYDNYETDKEPPTSFPEQLRWLLKRPNELAEREDTEEVVGPPIYGQWHAGVDELGDGPPWLGAINETPRLRLPAGFGTQVVQDHQEELMEDAWDQFGDLEFGNEVFTAAQLGGAVAAAIHRSLEDVPVAPLLELTTPMQSRIPWDDEITLHKRVLDVAPRAVTRPSFTRVTRPHGPFGQRFDQEVTALAGKFAAGTLQLDAPDRVDDRITDLGQRLESLGHTETLETLSVLTDGAGEAGFRPDTSWGVGGVGLEMIPDDVQTIEGEAELPEGFFEDEGLPVPDLPKGVLPGGEEGGWFVYTAGEAPDGVAEGDGPHPIRDAQAVLASVDDHCSTARDRLSTLGVAIARASNGRDEALETIREMLDDRPTVVDHTAAIRENTFHPLNRALSIAIASPAVEIGLTTARKDRLYGRVESLHAQAMGHLEAAIDDLRSPPFETVAVLDDIDAADRKLENLQHVIDTISTEFPAFFPADEDTSIQFLSGPDPGDLADEDGEAIVSEGTEIADQAGLLDSIHPEEYIVERVAERLALDVDWLHSRDDPLGPVMAHPEFPFPTYKWLRDRSPEYLLPGVDEIQKNTVGLLETNRDFVEAFMTGLNHEMARELLWRRYPTDRRGTYFERFWDRSGAPDSEDGRPPDIDPIHTWRGGLGDNGESSVVETKTVLLIKGELFERYPNTTVYAAKAVEDHGDRVPAVPGTHVTNNKARGDADPKDLLRFPDFEGRIEPDITFFGFDMDPTEAPSQTYEWQTEDGDGESNELKQGWFFVYEETPTEPRFGLDGFDAADVGSVPPGITYDGPEGRTTESWEDDEEEAGADAGWDAIAWSHVSDDAESVDDLPSYLSVTASRPATESWSVQETESVPHEDRPEFAEIDEADWGVNSAHLARATWQRPVRVAVHADDMLPENQIDGSGGS